MEVAKRIVIDPVTRACLEVDYPAAKTLKEGQTVHVHKGCLPWTLQEEETLVVGVGWKELPGRDRDYKCWACRGYLIEDPDEAARVDPLVEQEYGGLADPGPTEGEEEEERYEEEPEPEPPEPEVFNTYAEFREGEWWWDCPACGHEWVEDSSLLSYGVAPQVDTMVMEAECQDCGVDVRIWRKRGEVVVRVIRVWEEPTHED